ncbi:hypothetical protein L227DRAFT_377369 [Lentinus tigrinus ALCF2SS1-6]|uniref:Uncharacterized protein n=1 Tax=Lentinus tigrinus ALCF2SS1-6 TaxID=1328759 RepID=A0A5C2RTM0_9APHY|nr:hypothetical protein L227DRAFT_377369 [Lentinus tigrinus ALCF2SS1-6]
MSRPSVCQNSSSHRNAFHAALNNLHSSKSLESGLPKVNIWRAALCVYGGDQSLGYGPLVYITHCHRRPRHEETSRTATVETRWRGKEIRKGTNLTKWPWNPRKCSSTTTRSCDRVFSRSRIYMGSRATFSTVLHLSMTFRTTRRTTRAAQ